MARLNHMDGSAVYVFTVFSGIAITLFGQAYQAASSIFLSQMVNQNFYKKYK